MHNKSKYTVAAPDLGRSIIKDCNIVNVLSLRRDEMLTVHLALGVHARNTKKNEKTCSVGTRLFDKDSLRHTSTCLSTRSTQQDFLWTTNLPGLYLTLPLPFVSEWMTPSLMTSPSTETTARVQCAGQN